MTRSYPLLIVIFAGAALAALFYFIGKQAERMEALEDRISELEVKDVRREASWDGPKRLKTVVKNLLCFWRD